MGVAGCGGDSFLEILGTDVEGAGTRNKDAAGLKHLQGAEVEFLVAAQGFVEVALRFRKGGRVEDDGLVFVAGVGVVAEEVEGVGLDPVEVVMVEGGVFFGDFQRGTRAVDAGDARADGGEVEGKASVVAEDVEGVAVGVAGGGGVVFALVEEGSGFLAFEAGVVEGDAGVGRSSLVVGLWALSFELCAWPLGDDVHRDDRGTLFSPEQG